MERLRDYPRDALLLIKHIFLNLECFSEMLVPMLTPIHPIYKGEIIFD